MKWSLGKKELPNINAANQTWVFCKNSKHFQLQGHFLSPIFSILRNLHDDPTSPVFGLSSVFCLLSHQHWLLMFACFLLLVFVLFCLKQSATV